MELFDAATWETLDGFLGHLPRPVKLVVWGDQDGGRFEEEAIRLARALAERFSSVSFERRPRQPDYPYYPVVGIMGVDGAETLDYHVRFIGLPAGYQINALVGAIQAVSFRASNLEARTRIHLNRLPADAQVDLEVFTTAENEAGPLVATLAAGLAIASSQVRAFVIMVDIFPQAAVRYSVRNVPHTVINGRVHVEGMVDEAGMLRQIARSL